MTYLQAHDSRAKFMTRIAFNFAVFFTLATGALSVSADPFVYVDKEGNVHFQKPLNQVRSGAPKSQDELTILRLEAEYQAAIDDAADDRGKLITKRLNDWVNLWTKGGTFISDLVAVVAGFGCLPSGIVEGGNKVRGHANLKRLLEALEKCGVNGKRHMISGVRVEFITPELAIGQSEFAIVEATVVPTVVIATGRYNSVYQRVNGKWLFRQRKQDVDPAWGPAHTPPQRINSMQDLVFDLQKRVKKLEEAQ